MSNITVPSNDGPHGIVSFATPTAVTTEIGDNGTSIALLTVTRRYKYAQIIVHFATKQFKASDNFMLRSNDSLYWHVFCMRMV